MLKGKNKMTVNYTLSSLKNAHLSDTTSYIGQITHNRVLSADEICQRYAAKFNLPIATARLHLDCLIEYIASEVAVGNRMNFTGFTVSLKMSGRFPRGNERYNPNRNPVRVVLTPGKVLAEAVKSLTPVNATKCAHPKIDSVAHETLDPQFGYEHIRLDGGLTTMNTVNCKVNLAASDEGVYLTALHDDTPLLKAEVKANTAGTCDVVFPVSNLPSDDYYICINCRGDVNGPLVTARKKVHVESCD